MPFRIMKARCLTGGFTFWPTPLRCFRGPASRELLMVASILHDLGYHVNYNRHHRHTYHLIVHSELDGFNHRELEIIANIARYHRKAHPKSKHAEFRKMPRSDRRLVRVLAAVLRIADGLDRAHAGIVQSVPCEPKPGQGWFIISSDREPAVDLWGAERKSRLFQKVTGLEPRFLWDRRDADYAGPQMAAGQSPMQALTPAPTAVDLDPDPKKPL